MDIPELPASKYFKTTLLGYCIAPSVINSHVLVSQTSWITDIESLRQLNATRNRICLLFYPPEHWFNIVRYLIDPQIIPEPKRVASLLCWRQRSRASKSSQINILRSRLSFGAIVKRMT